LVIKFRLPSPAFSEPQRAVRKQVDHNPNPLTYQTGSKSGILPRTDPGVVDRGYARFWIRASENNPVSRHFGE
jgi:hypothetical protein